MYMIQIPIYTILTAYTNLFVCNIGLLERQEKHLLQ